MSGGDLSARLLKEVVGLKVVVFFEQILFLFVSVTHWFTGGSVTGIYCCKVLNYNKLFFRATNLMSDRLNLKKLSQ